MEAVREELTHHRGLLEQVLGNELPALRMELAFLRADIQALEERLSGEAPIFSEDSNKFTRSGVDVPPPMLAPPPPREFSHRSDKRHKPRFDMCHDSSDSAEEDLSIVQPLRFLENDAAEGDTGMAVSLEPNVWDCAMMIALYGWRAGSEMFGKFNAIMTTGLFLANMLIQFLFVLAVKSMVDYNPYEDEAMLNMRLQEGQHYSNMDHKTMTTKAQRTCDLKAYNMLGETVEWVMDYLQRDKDKKMVLKGDIICTLALITWVISIYSEVRRTWQDLISTACLLPTTKEVVSEHRAGLQIITGVPRSHKVAAVMVQVPRLIIAGMLCWYGMMFLAGTIELRELLTNAVALEFVKSIDEMLFEAIMPRKLMGYIRIVKIRVFQGTLPNEVVGGKLRMRGRYSADGSGSYSPSIAVQTLYVMMRIVIIAGAVLSGYFIFLQPIVGYTQNAYYEMCGENTNFTYIVHPITRVPIFANIDPYSKFSRSSDTGTLRCFYAAQYEMLRMRAGFQPQYTRKVNETLMSLVNGSNSLCWSNVLFDRSPVACPEQSIGYFNWMAVASDKQFFSSWDYCRDQDVFLQVLKTTCLNGTFFADSPEELAFFEDLNQCGDLRNECKSTAEHELKWLWQIQVQKLCPETCKLCKRKRKGGALRKREEAAASPVPPELPPSPLSPPATTLPPLPPVAMPPPGAAGGLLPAGGTLL